RSWRGAHHRLEHRRLKKLAGSHSRRYRRTGPRRRAEMARQETFGDRLSDQGCSAKTRGEALVIDIRTYSTETSLRTAPRPRARRMALVFAACLAMAPLLSTPSHAAA